MNVGAAAGQRSYTSVWLNVTATGVLAATFAENLTTNTGTPEWWLAQYGWTNEFEAAATNDADDDRMQTWAEYPCGTDPTNGSSFLGLDDVNAQAGGTGIVVRWKSVDGKSYRIERGNDLAGNPAFDIVVRTNIPGVSPANTETDKTAAGQGPWLYRIMLE